MIPILTHTPVTKLLFFDIETASAHKNVKKENPEMFELFKYKQRNKETEELPTDNEATLLYQKIAALSPIYGQVVCISAGVILADGTVKITSYTGKEEDILREFVQMVKKSGRTLVLFNAPFDIPFVRKRFSILGLHDYLTTAQGCDMGCKPWDLEKTVIDLMALWKGISYYPDSLDELCLALGVKSPKHGEVTGSNVSKSFHEGKIELIKEYCEKDVLATIEVFNKLKSI